MAASHGYVPFYDTDGKTQIGWQSPDGSIVQSAEPGTGEAVEPQGGNPPGIMGDIMDRLSLAFSGGNAAQAAEPNQDLALARARAKARQTKERMLMEGEQPSIDTTRGAPVQVRAAVGAAVKPEDRLSTIRQFYPDAQPEGTDNFTFTDPGTKRPTLYYYCVIR
jgi:hypothetical protein